ncbi:uncharacterized protein LOC143361999 [Halictus rubicundus]|uniref:uncharacterized protein LOC143361999 n=1 Tax=Halictus rubicundus TaxID=77578 RepID=UPI004037175D
MHGFDKKIRCYAKTKHARKFRFESMKELSSTYPYSQLYFYVLPNSCKWFLKARSAKSRVTTLPTKYGFTEIKFSSLKRNILSLVKGSFERGRFNLMRAGHELTRLWRYLEI